MSLLMRIRSSVAAVAVAVAVLATIVFMADTADATATADASTTTTTTTMTMRNMNVEPIKYEDMYGDNVTSLLGYVSLPQSVIDDDSKKVPAVVILPTWDNVNDYVKIRATMIADEYDWIGFAADIYGDDMHNVEDMMTKMEQATMYRSDFQLFNSRIQAAIDTIADHPNVDPTQISLIGYCLGGTGVLSYSFANTKTTNDPDAATTTGSIVGAVSFHGGLLDFDGRTDEEGSSMINPVLVLSGGDDDTGTAVEELEAQLVAANATWQITRYSDIEHGFTVFGRDAYDEWVDHRSWYEMSTFLMEVYGEIDYGTTQPMEDIDYFVTQSDADVPIGGGGAENSTAEEVAVQTVMYDDNGFALMGYVAMPIIAPSNEELMTSSSSSSGDSKKYPAVVIVPDWNGAADDTNIKRAVHIVQESTYVAMVADIYGVDYPTVDNFTQNMELSSLYRSDPTLFVSRIQAAINQLLVHPNVDTDNIFVAGYCLGGTGSLDYAFAPSDTTFDGVKAVVPIHGGLSPLRAVQTESVQPYVLVLSGGIDDAHGNTTELEQHLDGTDAKWEISRYSNAAHGFTGWGSYAYQPMADSRSWWSMMSLFAQLVKVDNNANNNTTTSDDASDDDSMKNTNVLNDAASSSSRPSMSPFFGTTAAAATAVVTATVTGMLV